MSGAAGNRMGGVGALSPNPSRLGLLANLFFRGNDMNVGDLVQIAETGVRLFVVFISYENGTPVYWLCHDKNQTNRISQTLGNPKWAGGYGAESLVKVLTTSQLVKFSHALGCDLLKPAFIDSEYNGVSTRIAVMRSCTCR